MRYEPITVGDFMSPHRFTDRFGGVSTGHLASLNLGFSRGDDRENVLENHRRLAAAVGYDVEKLVCTHQIHTDVVRVVTEADWGQGLFTQAPDCDGLVTNVPGTAVMAFGADCTVTLLEDPVAGAVGAVHAGWRGTALGIVAKAVDAMVSAFGSRREDIRACIGPSIHRCCFETRADVPEAMVKALGDAAHGAIDDHGDGTYHVDLQELNLLWLERAGIRNAMALPHCTACDTERFWSHRKTGDARGVQAGVIVCTGRKML